MNKVVLILFSPFIFLIANAQDTQNYSFYLTGEFNMGNYLGMNINANYIIDDRYSFQAGFSGHVRNGASKPADYQPRITGLLTLNLFTFDYMRNYQFMAGRIFKLNDRGDVRLNMSAGVGLTVISEPTNWQKRGGFPPLGIEFGSNYTYDIEKYSTMSIVINPKLEFPFTRIVGFSISPMLVINKDRTFVGLGFGMMAGLLRSSQSDFRINM